MLLKVACSAAAPVRVSRSDHTPRPLSARNAWTSPEEYGRHDDAARDRRARSAHKPRVFRQALMLPQGAPVIAGQGIGAVLNGDREHPAAADRRRRAHGRAEYSGATAPGRSRRPARATSPKPVVA